MKSILRGFFLKENIFKIFILGFIPFFFYWFILICSKYFFGLSFFAPLSDNPFFRNHGTPYYGIISNIGIFLWFASFSINLLLITKFKRDIFIKSKLKLLNSFYLGGSFSFLLFLCDLFDFQNNFSEKIVYTILASNCIFLFWYISHISFYRNIKYIFFIFGFHLAFSMGIDIYQIRNVLKIPHNYTSLIEELFKFIGIFYFAFFWVQTLRKFNKQNNISNLRRN